MRKFPHLRQWNVALIFCASVRDSIDRLGPLPPLPDPIPLKIQFPIGDVLWRSFYI